MSTELVHQPQVALAEVRDRFVPALSIGDAVERRNLMIQFMQRAMIQGVDYGTIPGTSKPVLLKPGAEKTSVLFGLSPDFVTIQAVEDWDGAQHNGEPFFYYRLKCRLKRGDATIGEGEGSCNSRESKYRYRWVRAEEVPDGLDKAKLSKRGGIIHEFVFSVEKAETGGKYGKSPEYWQMWRDAIAKPNSAWKAPVTTAKGKTYEAWHMNSVEYRVPNPDIADLVNTILKMAAKRAHVAAALNLGLSDLFTQDEEVIPAYQEQTAPAEEVEDGSGRGAPPPEETSAPATPGRFAFLDQFAKAKKILGNDTYYHILGANGFEHADDIPPQDREQILDELRETARARKA